MLALGPKRLGLTVLVTATIAGGNIGAVYAFSLTVAYVVIATALVTVPVVLAIVFGTRGEQWMLDGRALAVGAQARRSPSIR